MSTAAEAGLESGEYRYLPEVMNEPYLSARHSGTQTSNVAQLHFGAPVGLFFVMDRDTTLGSWLDCGMFMQNVMTMARAYGLETCPRQVSCDYGGIVHQVLDIPAQRILLSGMALGYIDPTALENQLMTERAPN